MSEIKSEIVEIVEFIGIVAALIFSGIALILVVVHIMG
jgi:hypothetical protein